MSQPESSVAPARTAPAFSLGFRLFSLTGVLPLGAFFVLHVASYARVLTHRESLGRVVSSHGQTVVGLLPEVLLLGLPLLYHAAYGLKLFWSANPRPPAVAGERALLALLALQRASGVLALAFVCYHVWQFRIPLALGTLQPADLFTSLCERLSTTSSQGVPVHAIAYLLGLGACSFHLARGLATFCVTWRIGRSHRQQRGLLVAFSLLGVSLFVVGADTILYFATGSGLVFDFEPPAALLGGGE